jgi:hypothetical protein
MTSLDFAQLLGFEKLMEFNPAIITAIICALPVSEP